MQSQSPPQRSDLVRPVCAAPAMEQVQGLLLLCLQVTIITSGALVTEDSSVASLHHQKVALLATANGTHIAVQVG